jgi:hypothetical protein
VGRPLAVLLLALVLVEGAAAHAPTTAIGRAVEAFGSVPVSYDPGAIVSEVEAANFGLLVGSNPKVAFMPASATSEIAGGPNAIASEIAREADLDGTLIVLAGAKPGAWSDEIDDGRLDELVSSARSEEPAGSLATMVRSLVRSVQAEPVDSGLPWGWIGAVLVVLAVGSLAAFDRLVRRRP